MKYRDVSLDRYEELLKWLKENGYSRKLKIFGDSEYGYYISKEEKANHSIKIYDEVSRPEMSVEFGAGLDDCYSCQYYGYSLSKMPKADTLPYYLMQFAETQATRLDHLKELTELIIYYEDKNDQSPDYYLTIIKELKTDIRIIIKELNASR